MNVVSSRIEPAVVEFIEREFLAVENAPLAAERLAQIHYALFVEGKTIAEVRAEFPSATTSDEAAEPNVEILSLDVRFRCVNCMQRLQMDIRSGGEMFDCPRCSFSTRTPSLASALDALSSSADDVARRTFDRMAREFRELKGIADEGCGARDDSPSANVLSIETRLCCGSCRQPAQIDARFHGIAVHCPACDLALRVPAWHELLIAACGDKTVAGPVSVFAPLTAQEREFLSAPFSQPRTGWLSGLSAGFLGGGV
jgi:hypothetical protein